MHSYLVAQLLEVLRVEEDESEEGARHRPLVPAVLEHDDVQHRRQHLRTKEAGLPHLLFQSHAGLPKMIDYLLKDLWPQLDHLNQRVVVGHHLAATNFA